MSALKRRELLLMIEEGESLYVEFKQRFSTQEKIAKEIIAFANTSGGYLIVGIDDNKKVYGVPSEKEETALISDAAQNFCEPPIEPVFYYFNIEHKEIVVAHILESTSKPHRLQDYKDEIDITTAQVYIRVNDKSVPAGKETIKLLIAHSDGTSLIKYTIGELEKIVFKHLEKNDTIDVATLKTIANISERRASRTLIKMVRANLLLLHNKVNGEVFFTGL